MRTHLVSDNNYNIVNLSKNIYKELKNIVRFTFSIGGTTQSGLQSIFHGIFSIFNMSMGNVCKILFVPHSILMDLHYVMNW
jgi:hypothetical protein